MTEIEDVEMTDAIDEGNFQYAFNFSSIFINQR